MSAPLILALMTFCFLFFGYLGVPVPFSLLAGVFIGALLTDVSLAADGAYAVEIEQRKDDQMRVARAGYVQSPSAEYLPNAGGTALLARISAVTGGQALPPTATVTSPDRTSAGDVRAGGNSRSSTLSSPSCSP